MVAIRKFYYSDVSAILVLIIATVMVIDLVTERVRHRLIGLERADDRDAARSRPRATCDGLRARHPRVFAADWRAARRSIGGCSWPCALAAYGVLAARVLVRRVSAPAWASSAHFVAPDVPAVARQPAARSTSRRSARRWRSRFLGTLTAAAAGISGRLPGGEERRPERLRALCRAACARHHPRRRHADLGADLDQRRRARAVRRHSGDRGVGLRHVRQAVLRGDRDGRREAGRGRRRRPAARSCTRCASACCRRSSR